MTTPLRTPSPIDIKFFLEAARQGDVPSLNHYLSTYEGIIDAGGSVGETALMEAASNGHDDCLILLLEAGANPNARMTDSEATALMAAVLRGRESAIKILLAAGAEKDAYTKDNTTALLFAVACNELRCLDTLLKEKVNLEIAMHGGLTPLLLAAREGRTECVKMLLNAGADPTKRTADGLSLQDLVNRQTEDDTLAVFVNEWLQRQHRLSSSDIKTFADGLPQALPVTHKKLALSAPKGLKP